MINELKGWVIHLQHTLEELARKYDQGIEDVTSAWQEFWEDGGYRYDQDSYELETIDCFKECYELRAEDTGLEPVESWSITITTVEGIYYPYYDCANRAFTKDDIAELVDFVGCRSVDWVRGTNKFNGELVDEQKHLRMIEYFEAYKGI